jgi:hypothetical protein
VKPSYEADNYMTKYCNYTCLPVTFATEVFTVRLSQGWCVEMSTC